MIFLSNFAGQVEDFIRQKRAIGFPYQTSELILKKFDRFCVTHYPQEKKLTREIAVHWAERLPGEHVNTLIRRVTPIRQFAKYLNSVGIEAYVLPPGIPAKGIRYVPHIYTQEELQSFFCTLDQCNYNKNCPTRHLVVPVIFRLLYCCGLRSSEVLNLKVENVDLTLGKLAILQSKGHKDRTVMMSDDVTKLCQIYHEKVSFIFPERIYFFPNHRGQHYSKSFLDLTFHEFWDKTGIAHVSGNAPRVHDFRYPNLIKIQTFSINHR